MLAALSLGVLLVGIELFITAVALPKIFLDLSSWSELRRASWIINAYLVSYIAVMPLAGRAADRFGLPRLVMLALAVFGVGSILCGAAQTLDQLLVGRTIQGAGAGALLPLATAGASHLYAGAARSRSLGIVGAATFLGMAIGPVLGVLVLGQLGLRDALAGVGIWSGPLVDLLTPAWRWVFYVTAPLALLAIVYVWAASSDWDVAPGRTHMDALGAILASAALASASWPSRSWATTRGSCPSSGPQPPPPSSRGPWPACGCCARRSPSWTSVSSPTGSSAAPCSSAC